MKTNLKIGDKIYKIEILEIDNNIIKVAVDDEEYFFKQDGEDIILLEENEIFSLFGFDEEEKNLHYIGEEKVIKAPISGTISKVFVKNEQKIKKGDIISILFSMKMENEIIAESSGIVKKLKIKEGDTVNKGDILIILE